MAAPVVQSEPIRSASLILFFSHHIGPCFKEQNALPTLALLTAANQAVNLSRAAGIIRNGDNAPKLQHRLMCGVARGVKDADCIVFLQWALPRLRMRWQGFRRVRRQVCRRLQRRLSELKLDHTAQYRHRLSADEAEAEWAQLDAMCRISVSRFYRDKGVFRHIEQVLLPCLQKRASAHNEHSLRVWSIGCASGEEPYTMALMGAFHPELSRLPLNVLATDTDPQLLARAHRACYPPSSLRELPKAWRFAFETRGDEHCLRSNFRAAVRFVQQDIRLSAAAGPFDMILCRNLVFTYFASPVQIEIARRLANSLVPGGYLVLGLHESIPDPLPMLETACSWLYRRRLT